MLPVEFCDEQHSRDLGVEQKAPSGRQHSLTEPLSVDPHAASVEWGERAIMQSPDCTPDPTRCAGARARASGP